MSVYDSNGDRVYAEDVLDADELEDYYRQRAEDFHTGRKHAARYSPTEAGAQASYEAWVMRDA